MTFRPLRRDLTETTRQCDFCPNTLGSLKAYVLEEIETGRMAYAGPVCARKHIGPEYSLRGLPDLTRSTLAGADVRGTDGGGRNSGAERERDDGRRRRAVE